ncbi:hypothetical protein ACGC1H_006982 [Rhizoctonia solani]|uniref:Uncharacterized protein n=1 Tax=Rhizoctonia solani TaxID=456999 RepID=A0A8H2XWX8_9AGAM|nr:unnamed protein product [Rhizoctonia solani]
MAPPPSAGPQKTRRPVLPSHVAHAHAFAAVPSPGAPKSASSSYFPLPNPPAPLRTFTLAPSETNAGAPASTSYSKSTRDRAQPAQITLNSGEKLQEVTNAPKSNAARQKADGSKSPFAPTPSKGSPYQFASAPFATCTPTRSSGFSSSSSTSARSMLSIAEIDCFFVQGSRSSAYSAPRSNSSSRSRPPSESGGCSAPLSELGLSSSEETGSGDIWVSEESERERQREERKAFMKARQSLREEARRKKRKTGGQADDAHTATWREVIQTRAAMPLKGIPESRAGSSRASASGSPRGNQPTTRPLEPLVDMLRTSPLPPGSGPGPPLEPDAAVNTLVDTLPGSMAISESLPEEQASEQTFPTDDTPPALNRFDSGETAVGTPATISVD